ncbi:TP53-target gene 5 protein [Sorex araneus]|uniref:TP53-target gene 5 protein n=1 Tax=Sorex araneus TaxID=42254 RepID=UPI002433AB80|nr:TP53-target gene 5 protein [Sorex araneus]
MVEALRDVPPVWHSLSVSVSVSLSLRPLSQMQDKALQSKTPQPVRKTIKRNRLKVVLKNLSLLKLLKSPNRRIQELYSLAKACWTSLLRVPGVLPTSPRNTKLCKMVKQHDQELQKAGSSQSGQKPENIETKEEPVGSKRSVPALRLRENQTKWPGVAKLQEQVEPESPEALQGPSRSAWPCGGPTGPLPTGEPPAVFLKTLQHRTPLGAVESQSLWFEGLPTRILVPKPRVLCRPSQWRWVNRCCTRSCSFKLRVYRPHGVA